MAMYSAEFDPIEFVIAFIKLDVRLRGRKFPP